MGKTKDVVTREYTINLAKAVHGLTFKKRAPRAVQAVRTNRLLAARDFLGLRRGRSATSPGARPSRDTYVSRTITRRIAQTERRRNLGFHASPTRVTVRFSDAPIVAFFSQRRVRKNSSDHTLSVALACAD